MPGMENMDVEKSSVLDVKDHTLTSPSYSTNGGEPNYEETTIIHQNVGRRLFESFKRDPGRTATPIGVIGANGRVYDGKGAAKATAASPLARKLKGRHLQMIAIGGSIGKIRKGADGNYLHVVANDVQVLVFSSHPGKLSKLEGPPRS